MNVKLVSVTPDAEKIIAYIARVSNPANQENPDYVKLIKFLIKNQHWSPFEHAYMTLEIKTSRAIAAQMIRHRSFSWQEYSQRYSEVVDFEPIELRRQATKNRQSSLEVFNPQIIKDGMDAQEYVQSLLTYAKVVYGNLLQAGVAKEVARMILPLTTQTTLYMTGTVRSWLHYILLRTKEDVQKEHRDIANSIAGIFAEQFPTVWEAQRQVENEKADKELLWSLLKDNRITINDPTVFIGDGILSANGTVVGK